MSQREHLKLHLNFLCYERKTYQKIDQKKYNELLQNSETMGPIQDVMWDIKKLSSFHIKYAFYDVLHLLTYMTDIYKRKYTDLY